MNKDSKYQHLLHVIAENPGLTADELSPKVTTTGVEELLQQAAANDDVVCVNDRYWVVRKGEFAFDTYDHPET